MAHTRFNVQEHLINLRLAREEAFDEGDWDGVNYIGLCIEDTEKQLASLERIIDHGSRNILAFLKQPLS
jgi:hypothetical protein